MSRVPHAARPDLLSRSLRRAPVVLAVAVALAAAAPASAVKRRAFATSVAGTGNLSSWPDAAGLSGLAAGDSICRARAAAAGLPNAATYRAWLSSSTTDAYCHVRGLTGKRSSGCTGGAGVAAGPWYLMNGITPFTAGLDELTGPESKIFRAVILDENGDELPSHELSRYWTGTAAGGEASLHCGDWIQGSSAATGTVGSGFGAVELWTAERTFTCETQRRLLCLEPGTSETVGMRWATPGAIVFVTSGAHSPELGTWAHAHGEVGLAAGDEICRTFAAAAHLPAPESFVAWLSDSLEDARDRVTSNGPFRRIDGLSVANTKADLIDGTATNSIHVDELGRYVRGGAAGGFVFTGTDEFGVVQSGQHCLDWTSTGSANGLIAGSAALSRSARWTSNAATNCASAQGSLYCLSNVVTLFWDGFDYTGDASRWSSSVP